ncbi:MAG: His/Gly/Thr/Pro-type tRNA ligase C-terminal domain-containing protein, partial [Clostridia bacterium]|nr:His/Gly/Thr/Pro-type tRNA ligase C-terminal domain-containing protein [Clostridia bacterium]
YKTLNKHFRIIYDETGSIGKRYRRQDAIGTPFCLTVDNETLSNNTVTIRNRDDMKQITIKLDEIIKFINIKLDE